MLAISTQKTKCLDYSLKKTLHKIFIQGPSHLMIPRTPVAYFGVILDCKLDFCEQTDGASSRFNGGIFRLRRLSRFDSGDLLLMVVVTLLKRYLICSQTPDHLCIPEVEEKTPFPDHVLRINFHRNQSFFFELDFLKGVGGGVKLLVFMIILLETFLVCCSCIVFRLSTDITVIMTFIMHFSVSEHNKYSDSVIFILIIADDSPDYYLYFACRSPLRLIPVYRFKYLSPRPVCRARSHHITMRIWSASRWQQLEQRACARAGKA